MILNLLPIGVPLSNVSVPSQVRSLAENERLGELLSVRDPRTSAGRSRTWLVVLGLPGLVMLPFTVHFLMNGFGFATVLSVLLTSAYLGAAGRIMVRDVLPGYGRMLFLYENGLILTTRKETAAYAWEAVEELRVSGARVGASDEVRWHFVLVRHDGRQAEVGDEFPGIQEVVELVSAAVTERVLPKYIARVDGGGSVLMGPFRITRDTIAKGGEAVAWRNVAEVVISNGMIYVDRSDGLSGMTANAGEIPNAVAFSELAHHVRELHAGPAGGS